MCSTAQRNPGITGKPQTFFSELALVLGACGFDTAVGSDGSQAAAGEAPPTCTVRENGPSHANVTAVFVITMKGFCDAAAPGGLTLMPGGRLRTPPPPSPTHTSSPPVPCRCIAHNCLSPSQHGHSVGLGLASSTYHTPPAAKVCVPLPLPPTHPPPPPSRMLTSAGCCPYMAGYGLHSRRFIRGYASLLHIFFPPASAFDITLLSSWHLCCLLVGRKIKKKEERRESERGSERERERGSERERLSSPPACSGHSRLY